MDCASCGGLWGGLHAGVCVTCLKSRDRSARASRRAARAAAQYTVELPLLRHGLVLADSTHGVAVAAGGAVQRGDIITAVEGMHVSCAEEFCRIEHALALRGGLATVFVDCVRAPAYGGFDAPPHPATLSPPYAAGSPCTPSPKPRHRRAGKCAALARAVSRRAPDPRCPPEPDAESSPASALEQHSPASPPPRAPGPTDELLARLAQLHGRGHLTGAEYVATVSKLSPERLPEAVEAAAVGPARERWEVVHEPPPAPPARDGWVTPPLSPRVYPPRRHDPLRVSCSEVVEPRPLSPEAAAQLARAEEERTRRFRRSASRSARRSGRVEHQACSPDTKQQEPQPPCGGRVGSMDASEQEGNGSASGEASATIVHGAADVARTPDDASIPEDGKEHGTPLAVTHQGDPGRTLLKALAAATTVADVPHDAILALKDCFAACDTDGDGMLDAAEIAAALAPQYGAEAQPLAAALMNLIDTDGGGTVSFVEFARAQLAQEGMANLGPSDRGDGERIPGDA